jgi:hypothetical protein
VEAEGEERRQAEEVVEEKEVDEKAKTKMKWWRRNRDGRI